MSNSRQDEWISEYRGFVADMSESVTIELMQEAPQSDFGYSMMYLKEGLNLVGVPRQSEMLEAVEDFYDVFPGVLSVKGLTPASAEWIELDDDTEISGETGYLLQCTEGSERAIWGVPWMYEPVSAAPGIEQWASYKQIATTWAQVKTGILKEE